MSAWPMVSLGAICQEDRVLIAPDSTEAEKLRYVGMEHIESETGTIDPASATATQNIQSQCFLFDSRHVLYGKLRPYLNKVALPDFRGRCSTELIPLLPAQNTSRAYLAYTLRRSETVAAAMGEKTGSRMPRADLDKLFRLRVPHPPLQEQQQIVAALDARLAAASRARAAVSAQLEAAERLNSVLLDEFFPSGSFPERDLEDLLVIPLRTGLSKPMLPTSKFKCLTLSAVRNGVLDLTACKPVDVTAEQAEKYQLTPDRFYVVRGNGNRNLVGRGALAPEHMATPMTFPDLLFEVVPNPEQLLPQFLRWVWDSPRVRRQIEELAQTSAGIYKINQGNLRQIRVPVPSVQDQERIVRGLQTRSVATQHLIFVLHEKLATLKKLPATLLREAFENSN